MRYLSHIAVGLAGAVVAAVAIWLLQSWNIARYESEGAAALRALQSAPDERDLAPLMRMIDPRIHAAERMRFYSLLAGLAAATGFLACLALRRGAGTSFVVVVSSGRARAASGRVPPGFVEEIGDCCREAGIGEAEVWGKPEAGRIGLGFSASVPAGVRQRIRNLWVQSGGGRKRRAGLR